MNREVNDELLQITSIFSENKMIFKRLLHDDIIVFERKYSFIASYIPELFLLM